MVKAYIQVKIEAGRDTEVFAEIGKLPDIKRANATYGICDMIIEADLPTIEDLDEFIFNKVRRVPGVRETATVIIAKAII